MEIRYGLISANSPANVEQMGYASEIIDKASEEVKSVNDSQGI